MNFKCKYRHLDGCVLLFFLHNLLNVRLKLDKYYMNNLIHIAVKSCTGIKSGKGYNFLM